MAGIFVPPQIQFLDNSNPPVPLSGGKVFTYVSGTSTPKATYTDSTETTPNANPVVLDANGRANIWLTTDEAYRIVLKDSTETTTYYTIDGVIPAGSTLSTGIELTSDLDVGASSIISRNNNNIPITPNGTGTTNITNLKLMSNGDGNGYSFKFDDLTGIKDDSGNEMLIFDSNSSAVNYFQLSNSATASAPTLKALGDDTNINITILPKGTGTVNVSGTTNYEDNVSDDDDIVNKKYVDDNYADLGDALTTAAHVSYSEGTPTLESSVNVTSITDAGTGLVYFSLTSIYSSSAGVMYHATAIGDNLIAVITDNGSSPKVGVFDGDSGTMTDPDAVYFTVLGGTFA